MPDSISSIISAATLLFLIMDPLGNVPLFLSLLKHVPEERRRPIILRELLIALGILLVFLFAGNEILNFLSLDQEAVRIAGGIILFIIALKMIFPNRKSHADDAPETEEPFIVPLAIPLIAGPSAMAFLILQVKENPGQFLDWLIALLIAWGLTFIILIAAPWFYKILRTRGLAAVERLMGMILIMVSVQMLLDGVRDFLPGS